MESFVEFRIAAEHWIEVNQPTQLLYLYLLPKEPFSVKIFTET